jgi:DNA-binding MarR family transcriptional regulator
VEKVTQAGNPTVAGKGAKREAFRNANEAWRRDNVGRAIFDATRSIESDVLKVLAKEGFPEIRMVHLNLYRNLDLDGTRLTELASRANMTKQGMQELIDRAERLGFVERRPDPEDRRAKVVAFSKRGLKLLEGLHLAVIFMEKRMAETIGETSVRQIARLLIRYNRQKPE